MIAKSISIGALALTLQGCMAIGALKDYIPSFWDDNQSAKIIDIRQMTYSIDCEQSQLFQAKTISNHIEWFQLYSESKGWRQNDVLKIVAPMKETVDDWVKRSREKEGSKTYCELKKRTLKSQADRAAEAVLGRF